MAKVATLMEDFIQMFKDEIFSFYSRCYSYIKEILIDKNINLCEKSENICAECIEILDSNTIINTCGFECDVNGWRIKTEGRDNIIFSEVLESEEEFGFELELTPEGDTLFLRDDEGKLVVWGSY